MTPSTTRATADRRFAPGTPTLLCVAAALAGAVTCTIPTPAPAASRLGSTAPVDENPRQDGLYAGVVPLAATWWSLSISPVSDQYTDWSIGALGLLVEYEHRFGPHFSLGCLAQFTTPFELQYDIFVAMTRLGAVLHGILPAADWLELLLGLRAGLVVGYIHESRGPHDCPDAGCGSVGWSVGVTFGMSFWFTDAVGLRVEYLLGFDHAVAPEEILAADWAELDLAFAARF